MFGRGKQRWDNWESREIPHEAKIQSWRDTHHDDKGWSIKATRQTTYFIYLMTYLFINHISLLAHRSRKEKERADGETMEVAAA